MPRQRFMPRCCKGITAAVNIRAGAESGPGDRREDPFSVIGSPFSVLRLSVGHACLENACPARTLSPSSTTVPQKSRTNGERTTVPGKRLSPWATNPFAIAARRTSARRRGPPVQHRFRVRTRATAAPYRYRRESAAHRLNGRGRRWGRHSPYDHTP